MGVLVKITTGGAHDMLNHLVNYSRLLEIRKEHSTQEIESELISRELHEVELSAIELKRHIVISAGEKD